MLVFEAVNRLMVPISRGIYSLIIIKAAAGGLNGAYIKPCIKSRTHISGASAG